MEEDILNEAMAELILIEQRKFSKAQSKAIDWPDIESKLEGMKTSLEADDSVAFKEDYDDLVEDLCPRNYTLREVGPEPEDPHQLAPEGARELLNHLIDQIGCKLKEPQSSGETQPVKRKS